MIKRIFALALVILMMCPMVASCKKDDGTVQMLSFSQSQSIAEMKKLDGKQVSIIGYMSTLSPVSGKFMYLMNLPYQSCPFCIPNTTQLSNTMAIYAKDKDGFEFTDRAIQVTGELEFGNYTDEFGYVYSYRIKDASYTVLDTDNMSEELKLWQQLASTNVVADIYTMFEYVNFLCFWPTYTASFESGKDYLYPSDALAFVEKDGAQYNYGHKSGYFDGLIATVKSVDETAFAELITIIERAEALADKAYDELKDEKYSTVSEYSNTFNDGRTQYQMDSHIDFDAQMKSVYTAFSDWLASWEL
jgi:hypothetical protein